MHKALYRKYRPQVFDDVIGQEHIIKTLKNQVADDSLSHAYLFCGTRGTGKTSTAKILSRAVNCTSDGEKPCNQCPTCKSIIDASNLDVIEIDAASNNSVDDIRELRETVKYTPSSSKYKVYIIDEVHMLSQGAFNALLKTLEEPPGYVIFILATTEPHKIPATILSRCQRFDFKRVAVETISAKMKEICIEEGIEADDDAIRIIARNGQGSVRDSLSILDKCISFCEDRLTSDMVIDLIGAADISQLFELGKSIIDSDLSRSMELIDRYFMWGKDMKILVEDLTDFFRSAMMIKISGNPHDLMDLNREYREKLFEMAADIEMDEIIRILNMMSELLNKMKTASNQRMILEIYFIKMASPSADSGDSSLVRRIENIEKIVEDGKINVSCNIDEEVIEKINSISSGSIYADSGINKENISKSIELNDNSVPLEENFDIIDDEDLKIIKDGWDELLERMMKDRRAPIRAFLIEAKEMKYKNGILYFIFENNNEFAVNRLNTNEENRKYLKNLMKSQFGLDIDFRAILRMDMSKMNFDKNPEEKEKEEIDKGMQVIKNALGPDIEIKKE